MMSPTPGIGTFRTSSDVRLESGMRTKADLRRPLLICGFTPTPKRPRPPAGELPEAA
jgi:hypothetical protein